MHKISRNKAQEEIVGFAVIMVIVAIILVIILGFTLRKPSSAKTTFQTSYQAESFTQTLLQYTTDCTSGQEYLNMQDIIISCNNNEQCDDGRTSCSVLEAVLRKIIDKSWNVGTDSSVKGYDIKISTAENAIIDLNEGNKTASSRGAVQDFSRSGTDYEMTFQLYF